MTAALLLVMMEPPAPLEEEFNDWYDTEHLPQRLSLPGILSATRWACVDGWPRWMALYDLASLDAVKTPEYLAVSGANPTPWSRRLLPRTIGRTRLLATAVATNAGLQAEASGVSRLLLARYPLGGTVLSAAEPFAATARRLAEVGAVQTRGFLSDDAPHPSLWVTSAFAHPVGEDALRSAAARCSDVGATLFNVYLPYRRA